MELLTTKNGIEAVDFGEINLHLTLDCGQAFRWEETEKSIYSAVAFGKDTRVKKTPDGLLFIDTPKEDVENIWAEYFDLYTDHKDILSRICEDSFIKEQYDNFGTLRILNQEPSEALISFIISSCNNIPRIKGIIKRLSEAFGEKTKNGYAFPSPEVLALKTEEDLSVLKAGYRVPYILDAARKIAEGEIDFDAIKKMDEDSARRELMKIRGVGKKVADCTMLFSLGFKDIYPVDRHIERATARLYPDGLPSFFSPNKGLAQQYIFLNRISEKS